MKYLWFFVDVLLLTNQYYECVRCKVYGIRIPEVYILYIENGRKSVSLFKELNYDFSEV